MTPDPVAVAGRTRTMDLATAPMVVSCRRHDCLAAAGYHCKSARGYQNSAVRFHAARRQDVSTWPEADIIAAQTRLRGQLQALRDARLSTVGMVA